MTALAPVYEEVRSYLQQIRDYLDAIERSLQRLPEPKETDDRPTDPD